MQGAWGRALTTPVNIRLDQDIHTTDTIKRNLDILILAPVAHFGHIRAAGLVLLVALGEHDVLVQTRGELEPLFAFLP